MGSAMNEAELVRRIIDFSLIIKGQINRKETELLRSILNNIIMEVEDVLEEMQIDGASATHQVG